MEYLPALIEALPDQPAASEDSAFARQRQVDFLHALAASGSVRGASARARVSHQTAYRERLASPVFRRAWDAALLAARALAEEVLASRAIDGVEEEVLYHGEVVATRRRYDGRLLLAHLARLDRLTADARTGAFADDFTASVARFGEGSDTPETAPAPEPLSEPRNGPDISSPGQWSTRSTAPTRACPHCGGRCDPDDREGQFECPAYPDRLDAMDAARPRGAKEPDQLTGEGDRDGAIEAEQLAAFEEGVERWWLVLPPDHPDAEREERDGWWYCDERGTAWC
jgi:hypothetical protein